MNTLPFWLIPGPGTRYSHLEGRVCVDVAVIGGGMAGLSTAFALKRAGLTVALIESRRIGEGETGRTTAHLTELVDPGYRTLVPRFGERIAGLVREASRTAIERIENWAGELGAPCSFERVPAYLYAESEDQLRDLDQERRALHGVDAQEPRKSLPPLPFASRIAGSISLPNQAQFNPIPYVRKLAEAIRGGGSHVFENSHVSKIEEDGTCVVSCPRGEVVAERVVVTTDSPVSNRLLLHTKLAAYRSYVLGLSVSKEDIPEPGLYLDMDEPYHYIRCATASSGERVLLVGGEDHKTGDERDTLARFNALERYARDRFAVKAIRCKWSGQIMEPIDGLPYIGLNPFSKRLYVATGFSGNGMTYSTIAGMLISDLVQGKENSWAEAFEPSRAVKPSALKEFVSENKDFPLCWLKDRLAEPEAASVAEVPKGEGRIMRVGKKKVAVYKDPVGRVQAVSATCTHMGCIVRWNNGEKSWDCPCHGARFDTCGKVLHGPAISPLEEVADLELSKADEDVA